MAPVTENSTGLDRHAQRKKHEISWMARAAAKEYRYKLRNAPIKGRENEMLKPLQIMRKMESDMKQLKEKLARREEERLKSDRYILRLEAEIKQHQTQLTRMRKEENQECAFKLAYELLNEQEKTKCPCCQNFFSKLYSPRVLNCGHTACLSCLEDRQSQNKKCALCPEKVVGKLDELPTNRLVMSREATADVLEMVASLYPQVRNLIDTWNSQ